MRIGVIGAGHAGVEAARTAVALGHQAVLFCGESHLPYYRPRIVAYAFGQSSLQDCIMHDAVWYEQNGITLRQGGKVTAVDADSASIEYAGAQERFDGIIIAVGAGPVMPPAFGGVDRVLPLWTLDDADRIRGLMKTGAGLIIIGGGVIGIETALRAADVGMKVVILERMEKVMPRNLTSRAADALCALLEQKSISLMCGVSVKQLNCSGGAVRLQLEDGAEMRADAVIVSIGAARDFSVFSRAGVTCDRGIVVDKFLMTNRKNIYACGDIAQSGNILRCSARTAMAQAKCAAANLSSDLTGGARAPYLPAYEPLMLKYKETELYAAGIIPENGYDEEVIPDAGLETGYAARITMGGVVAGIQIVGSGKGLMKYLKEVK